MNTDQIKAIGAKVNGDFKWWVMLAIGGFLAFANLKTEVKVLEATTDSHYENILQQLQRINSRLDRIDVP